MTNKKIVIENILRNMENSAMSSEELKRKVKNRVNNKSLTLILKHLESEGKIFIGSKGITWIYSNSQHLKSMLKNSLEI